MINLCPPAIVYLFFSVTQILIDLYKQLYNTAFTKTIVTIMVTSLLNILCIKGFDMVAWVIVFIPFLLMSVIVGMLLYVFGLDVSTGNLNYNCDNASTSGDGITRDKEGNIIIYDPEYNTSSNKVYYSSPNIIIPNPNSNNNTNATQTTQTTQTIVVPHGTSDPAY